MALVIPPHPDALLLSLRQTWDGRDVADPRLHGFAALAGTASGLRIRAGLPDPEPGAGPDAAPGTRVWELWEHDVVEVFLVGKAGDYLEVELGARGHYLVLTYRRPREGMDPCLDLALRVEHALTASGWSASLEIPWSRVPRPLVALNAFGFARRTHLAHAPLPGPEPDFHQPDRYPAARLAARLAASLSP